MKAIVLALTLALQPVPQGDYSQVPGNPFGIRGVLDFHGRDVVEFAGRVTLAGDAADPNAEPWADEQVRGTFDSIDGEWAGRWNLEGSGVGWKSGTAKILSLGSRVFVLYEEPQPIAQPPKVGPLLDTDPAPTGPYRTLIELVREGDRLVGRYANPEDLADTSPWVGKIVDAYRIDGRWAGGRWDLRRGRSGDSRLMGTGD